ncbi:hypothetical protein CEXT_388941 [Caerostris extrusa]|uniref:Uncharacterized protein n=1 Tax=Caerostris extrusa TaxID=172846 RepID=A0AAV4ML53_CAEEX|nr:hypothetical protein CEXT_388941 [Caerostris extrusa]
MKSSPHDGITVISNIILGMCNVEPYTDSEKRFANPLLTAAQIPRFGLPSDRCNGPTISMSKWNRASGWENIPQSLSASSAFSKVDTIRKVVSKFLFGVSCQAMRIWKRNFDVAAIPDGRHYASY